MKLVILSTYLCNAIFPLTLTYLILTILLCCYITQTGRLEVVGAKSISCCAPVLISFSASPLFVTSPFIQLSFTNVGRRRCDVIICLSSITLATLITLSYNLEITLGTPVVLHFLSPSPGIDRKHEVPLILDSSYFRQAYSCLYL